MIIPVRCLTCNRLIASKYKKYKELIASEEGKENIMKGDPDIDNIKDNAYIKAFEEIGIDRICCKRMVLTNIDLIDKI